MNQVQVQNMVEERLRDAKVLLDGGRWEFAYYSDGYAIECALKSGILARMIHTAWVFEEKGDAKVCLEHKFAKLVYLAGLTDQLNDQLKASWLPLPTLHFHRTRNRSEFFRPSPETRSRRRK